MATGGRSPTGQAGRHGPARVSAPHALGTRWLGSTGRSMWRTRTGPCRRWNASAGRWRGKRRRVGPGPG
jgi:hypothetical protein